MPCDETIPEIIMTMTAEIIACNDSFKNTSDNYDFFTFTNTFKHKNNQATILNNEMKNNTAVKTVISNNNSGKNE